MPLTRFSLMSIHEQRLLGKGFQRVAGIDEAGRGPLAGPVIAAACILPKGVVFETLNDSKQLTQQAREALYLQLIETPGVVYGIGEASIAEIDRHNILKATLLAMQRSVKALSISPDYLLIDGNRSPTFTLPKETLIKGDCLSVSIAAASILAKVLRDRIMQDIDKKWPMYGFGKHKGYGTKDHLDAIRKWGPCPAHRRTFSPIKSYEQPAQEMLL